MKIPNIKNKKLLQLYHQFNTEKCTFDFEEKSGYVYINLIWLDESIRRQGVTKYIFSELFKICNKIKKDILLLPTEVFLKDKKLVINIFKSLGFVEYKEKKYPLSYYHKQYYIKKYE